MPLSRTEVSMDLFPVIRKQMSRFIVITQSPLSKQEFDDEFKHYQFFDIYEKLNRVELYYMNPYGKLYKSVQNIEDI